MGSNKIKELRNKTGLSQTQFAKRFHIPVSTLRKWEQMESKPPLYFVLLLEKEIASIADYDKKLISEKNEYYINFQKKIIIDKYGNILSYEGNIDLINDNFLLFGIEPFFNKYYELTNNLNRFINDASIECLREKENGNK